MAPVTTTVPVTIQEAVLREDAMATRTMTESVITAAITQAGTARAGIMQTRTMTECAIITEPETPDRDVTAAMAQDATEAAADNG